MRMPMRGAGFVFAVGLAVLAAGCVAVQSGERGAPWFPYDERAEIDRVLIAMQDVEGDLAQHLGHWSLHEAERYLATLAPRADGPPPDRRASHSGSPPVTRIAKTWRFAVARKIQGSVPTYGRTWSTRYGFELELAEEGGRLALVETRFTALTEREREWTTKPLVAVGTSAGMTLLMLSGE